MDRSVSQACRPVVTEPLEAGANQEGPFRSMLRRSVQIRAAPIEPAFLADHLAAVPCNSAEQLGQNMNASLLVLVTAAFWTILVESPTVNSSGAVPKW